MNGHLTKSVPRPHTHGGKRGLCVSGRTGAAGAGAAGARGSAEAPAGASGAGGAPLEGQPQLSLFSGMVSSEAMQNAFKKARSSPSLLSFSAPWCSYFGKAASTSVMDSAHWMLLLVTRRRTAGCERGSLQEPAKGAGGDVGAHGEGEGGGGCHGTLRRGVFACTASDMYGSLVLSAIPARCPMPRYKERVPGDAGASLLQGGEGGRGVARAAGAVAGAARAVVKGLVAGGGGNQGQQMTCLQCCVMCVCMVRTPPPISTPPLVFSRFSERMRFPL